MEVEWDTAVVFRRAFARFDDGIDTEDADESRISPMAFIRSDVDVVVDPVVL